MPIFLFIHHRPVQQQGLKPNAHSSGQRRIKPAMPLALQLDTATLVRVVVSSEPTPPKPGTDGTLHSTHPTLWAY